MGHVMSYEDHKSDLFDEARLGIEVQEFLSTKIGRYLIGRAEIEAEEAFKRFKEVDPENAEEIRKLKQDALLPSLIKGWLASAINNGRVCEYELKTIEDNERGT